jgi:hypothetical protein
MHGFTGLVNFGEQVGSVVIGRHSVRMASALQNPQQERIPASCDSLRAKGARCTVHGASPPFAVRSGGLGACAPHMAWQGRIAGIAGRLWLARCSQ